MRQVRTNLVVAVITIVLIELVAALFLWNPRLMGTLPVTLGEPLSLVYAKRIRHSIALLPDCGRYDKETFYTLKPGDSCVFENLEFKTRYSVNSAGLRDEEGDLRRPEIIALGDSFTMGWGVEQDETFVAQLEKMTGRKILNAGISSFGTEREARLFRRLDRSRVKTVILQYSGNDEAENEAASKPGGLKIRSRSEYERISRKHVRKTKYFPFKLTYYLLRDTIRRKRDSRTPMPVEDEVRNFLAAFERIRGLAPEARFLITELNGRGQARSDFLNAVQRAAGDDPLITTVNVEANIPDEFYFPIDHHLTAAGQRAVAMALAPFLDK